MSLAKKLTTIAKNEQKVFEAGKQTEYDMFWDAHQKNGQRTDYDGAFGGWLPVNFRPKYSMYVDNARYMFRMCRGTKFDLVERLKQMDVILDFSNCSNFRCTFNMSSFTRVGEINISKAAETDYIFGYATSLITIDNLIFDENGILKGRNNEFHYCTELQNIKITGVIGQNGWNFNYCEKLTHDSLMSIINALKDYSGTTTTKTLTLGATNLAKLTSAEKAIATEKGWTLA